MRIYISSPREKTINLRFPTRLVFNKLTAIIGAKAMNKHIQTDEKLNISSHDMKRFFKELIRMKKKYPDLYLVDVESADGDVIKIIL